MPIPRVLAEQLLPPLSWVLHRAPIKTRLGGLSTLASQVLGLSRMTEQRTAVLRNGICLPVRLSDYNGRMLYLFGTPDPKIITVCRSLLRPGDVMLDIGANFGTVGLLTHDRLGETGALHFVEPQPELCAAIEKGVDQRKIPNAHIHNCGMWDEDGELTLSRPKAHTGAASFAVENNNAECFTVPVRSADSFLDEHVGDRPFAAKIDVEGAEPRILPSVLSRPSLRFALFECNVPSVREHAWTHIQEGQLVFFTIRKHLLRTRLHPIRTQQELGWAHDVLAVRCSPNTIPHKSIHPDQLARLLHDPQLASCPA